MLYIVEMKYPLLSLYILLSALSGFFVPVDAQECIDINDRKHAASLPIVKMQRDIPRAFEVLTQSRVFSSAKTKATVKFEVKADLLPDNFELKESSGDSFIDAAAIQAVKDSAPFRKSGSCFEIGLQFVPPSAHSDDSSSIPEFETSSNAESSASFANTIYKRASAVPRSASIHKGPIVKTPGGKVMPNPIALNRHPLPSLNSTVSWQREAQCKLQNAWQPTTVVKNAPKMLFELRIGADGDLKQVLQKVSSGDKLLDTVALEKIKGSSPFAAPPDKKENTFIFQFDQSLKARCVSLGYQPEPSMIAGRRRDSYNQSGSPGGVGGRAGIDAISEPDFGPYIAELQRRIRRNWAPPAEGRGKRVIALFEIARDGRLLSLKIKQSSGSSDTDRSALAAVRASAPFRQLPVAYRKNDIDVEFIFDSEVYGRGMAKMSN